MLATPLLGVPLLVGLLLAELALAAAPSIARANDDALEHAIAFAEDADFASALAAFEEAESSDELTREDLTRLYAHRAMVHFALGELGAMNHDLVRLVALDHDASLPAAAPPPVREALDTVRGETTSPTVHAEARATSSGVEVRARAEEDGTDLVRRLRAWARREREEEWRRGDGGAVDLEAAPGETVLWYAEAIGPGGALIATEHTRVDPAAFVVPEREVASASTGEGGSDETTWWLVGGGIAAVVVGAAVAVAVVVATSETPTTTLSGPALVL